MKEIKRMRNLRVSALERDTILEALEFFEEMKRIQDLEHQEIRQAADRIRNAPVRNGAIKLELREKEEHEVVCKALDELWKTKRDKKEPFDRTLAIFLKAYNAPTSKEMHQMPEQTR